MCSGKYIDIYFIMKITYPISTLPEHIHSTIRTIVMDGGMCWYCKQGVAEQGHKTTQKHPWVLMPEPVPRRSVKDRQVQCPSQEGHNIYPSEG